MATKISMKELVSCPELAAYFSAQSLEKADRAYDGDKAAISENLASVLVRFAIQKMHSGTTSQVLAAYVENLSTIKKQAAQDKKDRKENPTKFAALQSRKLKAYEKCSAITALERGNNPTMEDWCSYANTLHADFMAILSPTPKPKKEKNLPEGTGEALPEVDEALPEVGEALPEVGEALPEVMSLAALKYHAALLSENDKQALFDYMAEMLGYAIA